jgi:parallel beta-helix repeat protein
MRKKYALLLTLLIVLLAGFVLKPPTHLVKAQPKTWIVDDDEPADFHTISEAINASQDGDTIFVKAGLYLENLYVDKMVTLTAENYSAVIRSVTEDVGSTVRLIATKAVITGFTIEGGSAGIFLNGRKDFPVETVAKGNIVANCRDYGIYVYWSNGSLVTENIIKNNTKGLYIYWSEADIARNVIENNSYGIYSVGLRPSTIRENTIQNNSYGMLINFSAENKVFHNNFVNNTYNAYVDGDVQNLFDNAYPSSGNYWNDYNGTDAFSGLNQNETGSDGIGDQPYIIYENHQDRYPLTASIKIFEAGTFENVTHYVDVISNSTISAFFFKPNETLIQFNATERNETTGFCRVIIPKALLWVEDGWRVFTNEEEASHTTIADGSCTYLYFKYNHSTKTIRIMGTNAVPEFRLTAVTALFVAITLLLIVAYKRRYLKQLRPISASAS